MTFTLSSKDLKFHFSVTPILKMGTAGLLGTPINTCLITWSYNPDDQYLHFHHIENINSEIYSHVCPYDSDNSWSDTRCSHTKHNATSINTSSCNQPFGSAGSTPSPHYAA